MTLEEFLDGDDFDAAPPPEPEPKPLNSRSWRAQIERVLDAYIGECEKYRREHKALQDQVNELTRVVVKLGER